MMKKTLPLIALLIVLFAGSAHAAYTGTTYNNDFLTDAGIDGDLSSYLQDAAGTGIWDITAVRSQASFHNRFNLTDGSTDTVLFYNKDTSNWDTPVTVDIENTFFTDGYSTYNLGLSDQSARVYTATVIKEFSYKGILFGLGDLVIMVNDAGGDNDFDDFVLHGTAATPIPGAVWLLGSGLAGLVGIRRKFA